MTTEHKLGKKSAGILLYRLEKGFEVFLVHPGGPFFAQKDLGAWSIPKGEFTDEEPLEAAKREFQEEVGLALTGEFIELSPVKHKSGKMVFAWAQKGNVDPQSLVSNTFEMQWPPLSGKFQEFPEVDRGEWFTADVAKQKINPAQIPLIDELIGKI